MKRLLALLGILILLAGCGAAEEKAPGVYDLYFQERELHAAAGSDALRAVSFRLRESEDPRQLAESLMEALLAGPADTTLRATAPAGTSLLSLTVENGLAQVDLSAQYGMLSGVRLAMADSAIALTLTQLPEITAVRITVRGRELSYRDRQSFSARDVLLTTMDDRVGAVTATLWFLDENGDLTPEERTLELYEGDTQVETVVEALLAGPQTKGLSPALPEETRVRAVWTEDAVCYVNLSAESLAELQAGSALASQALGRSLASLESVEEVRFLADGELTGLPDL